MTPTNPRTPTLEEAVGVREKSTPHSNSSNIGELLNLLLYTQDDWYAGTFLGFLCQYQILHSSFDFHASSELLRNLKDGETAGTARAGGTGGSSISQISAPTQSSLGRKQFAVVISCLSVKVVAVLISRLSEKLFGFCFPF